MIKPAKPARENISPSDLTFGLSTCKRCLWIKYWYKVTMPGAFPLVGTMAALQEEHFQCFLETYDYYAGHRFTTELKSMLVDSWDMYIKTFIYYKYWKKDLCYFPKYQGSEGIKWLEGYRTYYRNRMIIIEMNDLQDFILNGKDGYKNFIEHELSTHNPEEEALLQKAGKPSPLSMLSEHL